jgi:hypothetical protein
VLRHNLPAQPYRKLGDALSSIDHRRIRVEVERVGDPLLVKLGALPITVKMVWVFQFERLVTVGDLLNHGRHLLTKMSGVGPKTVADIDQIVEVMGLSAKWMGGHGALSFNGRMSGPEPEDLGSHPRGAVS